MRRFRRYALLGVATNGTAYLAFLSLIAIRVPAVAANALCYLLALVLSYLGNRTWTFQSANRHGPDMLRFAGAHGFGLVASVATMVVLTRFMPAFAAQIVTMGTTAILIYAMLHVLRFGQPQPEADNGPCG